MKWLGVMCTFSPKKTYILFIAMCIQRSFFSTAAYTLKIFHKNMQRFCIWHITTRGNSLAIPSSCQRKGISNQKNITITAVSSRTSLFLDRCTQIPTLQRQKCRFLLAFPTTDSSSVCRCRPSVVVFQSILYLLSVYMDEHITRLCWWDTAKCLNVCNYGGPQDEHVIEAKWIHITSSRSCIFQSLDETFLLRFRLIF